MRNNQVIRFHTKILAPLSIFKLPGMSYPSRVMLFYSVKGSNKNYGFTHYTADEVAEEIGMPKYEDNGSKTTRAAKVRNLRNELVSLGRLEKNPPDPQPYENYTWYVPTQEESEPSDEGIRILNKGEWPGRQYCREDQLIRAHLDAGDLDRLPDIYMVYVQGLNSNARWDVVLSDLFDWAQDDTWKFWITDIKKALSDKNLRSKNKEHPLLKVKDMDIRIQTALTGLEIKFQSSINNAGGTWKPNRPARWVCSQIWRVGLEEGWESVNWKDVKSARGKSEGRTLRQLAHLSASPDEDISDIDEALEQNTNADDEYDDFIEE